MLKNFLEKVQKKGPAGRKRQDRKGNRTMQKNKTGDTKVESNDSPEIPDRGGDIRHPQHLFGEIEASDRSVTTGVTYWHYGASSHKDMLIG